MDNKQSSRRPQAPAGFADLYERERAPMIRLASLIVGSSETAEDVVQEAFIAVEQRWSQLDRRGAYLRTSVVNGCRAVMRHRQVRQRHAAAPPSRQNDDLPTHLVELRDALDHLTERQRIVVVLRYFVDIPEAEIAEHLGCRPSTVRSLNRRALQALRKELA